MMLGVVYRNKRACLLALYEKIVAFKFSVSLEMFANCCSNCSNSCYNVHSHALILCNGNKFYFVCKQINVGSFIFGNRENISKLTNIHIEMKIVFRYWIPKSNTIGYVLTSCVDDFLEELYRKCAVHILSYE